MTYELSEGQQKSRDSYLNNNNIGRRVLVEMNKLKTGM